MAEAGQDPLMALPPLREVIARFGLSARKQLGQNFILDLNLTRRIARAAGDLSTGTTIEIGPGPGGLTRALLLEGAAKVVAIEKDTRCLAALAELADASKGRLHLIEADALQTCYADIGETPRRIVANLPYNIATPLLIGWLGSIAANPKTLDSLTLMFQQEVAERLYAIPATKAYGRLSVLTQWLCDCRPLFLIAPSAFVPPPKVTSAVVQLVPLGQPRAEAKLPMLERVTAAAFGQRRKTLRQALKSLGVPAQDLLARADIDGRRRGETLTVEEFCALARTLDAIEGSA